METKNHGSDVAVLESATAAPLTDRMDVQFEIEDLVRQAFPQALTGHCAGCNGCSGCSH
jgi:hypothetical protein